MICKRCNGEGYIPEYKHVQNGICFSCWGSGNRDFEDRYPRIFQVFTEIVENDSTKRLDIITISQEFFQLDGYLKQSIIEEDLGGISYYETRMNELLTKLYNLNT